MGTNTRRHKNMPKMQKSILGQKEISWPYIAGFFDAEGTFYIKPNSYGARTYYFPKMRIDNNNKNILLGIQRRIKCGRIYSAKNRFPTRHINRHSLEIQTYHDIEYIVPRILPYLTIKQKRARIILKLISNWRKHSEAIERVGRNSKKAITVLNKRGK